MYVEQPFIFKPIIDDNQHIDWYDNDEPCLIQQFFEQEAKKPPSQRSNACMISCPCSRCSPQC